MAPTLTRTREQVLAAALGQAGTWWPNPWWPTGVSAYNDCMAFVSWALFGLNGRAPFYTFVPHIMERAISEDRWAGVTTRDGKRSAVAATTDIQRGDVVIFDWRFIDSRDHVGIATGPIVGGVVPTMQTNNGGGGQGGGADSARVVGYPQRFILGRYRPPYATVTPASPTPATPISIDHEEDDVIHVHNRATTGTHKGWQGVVGLGYARHFNSKVRAAGAAKRYRTVEVNGDAALGDVFNDHGLARAQIPRNNGEVWAKRS